MAGDLMEIPINGASLEGELAVPEGAAGLVVFVHGSGSSRFSPRNNQVARAMRERGLATFLFDLLTAREDEVYANRFDIPLLADRLRTVHRWITGRTEVAGLPVGLFGASTGAAAALTAAADLGDEVGAVVSRGGRPDLAADALERVAAPTLLIVGGLDQPVIELNQQAFERLAGPKDLEIVEGATHLFEEPGTLEQVSDLAVHWFRRHLAGDSS
jgi:dienelactone hydrolase